MSNLPFAQTYTLTLKDMRGEETSSQCNLES